MCWNEAKAYKLWLFSANIIFLNFIIKMWVSNGFKRKYINQPSIRKKNTKDRDYIYLPCDLFEECYYLYKRVFWENLRYKNISSDINYPQKAKLSTKTDKRLKQRSKADY